MSEKHYGILQRVKIDKMWGKKNIDIKFSPINLFVGINGSGKTTFIKIIEAVASFDPEALNVLKFKKCSLFFDNEITISCEKYIDENDPDIIKFKVVQGKDIFSKKIDTYTPRMQGKKYIKGKFIPHRNVFVHELLKNTLKKYIKISWISVERNRFEVDDEYNDRSNTANVDNTLNCLINEIQNHKSYIESQEKEILETFRNRIFELMLYDENIDTVRSIAIPKDNNWVAQLNKAFQDLGLQEMLSTKINKHIEMLKRTFLNIENYKDQYITIVLPLFNRTQQIIKYSEDADNKRKDVRKDFELYLKNIKKFIGKNIEGIHTCDAMSDERLFQIEELSSGEKQILILLSEAFLQHNEKVLFIADEPELSLHISWQREIITAVHSLNPNAQIIFATHSPEVVCRWKQCVINMENIVREDA